MSPDEGGLDVLAWPSVDHLEFPGPEVKARHAAEVAGFFTHHPAWTAPPVEPFVLPDLPESLPAAVPPWGVE